jgi:hypothetical protein
MSWVRLIVNQLRSDLGGIVTFVEDPDGLLEGAEVREALRRADVSLATWDETSGGLAEFSNMPPTEKAVVPVPDGAGRHLVESSLTNARWERLSLGSLFSKFAVEVVRALPVSQWDALLLLHEAQTRPLGERDTALLVSRALYGADSLYLRYGPGWPALLHHIADSGQALPLPLAEALAQDAPTWLEGPEAQEALTSPAAARTTLEQLAATRPELVAAAGISMESEPAEPSAPSGPSAPRRRLRLPGELPITTAAADVLRWAEEYTETIARDRLSEQDRLSHNQAFLAWLQTNYGTLLTTLNRKVVCPHRVLDWVEDMAGDVPWLLLVCDGLSMAAWRAVAESWQQTGCVGEIKEQTAFALLPTLTILSRRAIFEGRPPSQFRQGEHTPRLERRLWQDRYAGAGDLFGTTESLGLQDALSLRKARLCLVDVEWDHLAHKAAPQYQSVDQLARMWATQTPLCACIQQATGAGYRVFLTADHGQVGCTGRGRLAEGELAEERTKRVRRFADAGLRDRYSEDDTMSWSPPGLPPCFHPLFATGFGAFERVGARSFSHGGLSIEEVVVPLVEVVGP